MLQQTQVATVLPRYQAWLDMFPDIQSLATASLDDVLKAWEGLGYYRRARFIHAAVQLLMTQHSGEFPHDFEEILKLPGIGRSTAGAIASFCFGHGRPVLDGNVKRVLKRWHGMPEPGDKALWQKAHEAIDASDKPADWNQAMMELGATICSTAKPDCRHCPVQKYCDSAFQINAVRKEASSNRVLDVHWQVNLYLDDEKGIWLTKRPDTGIWAGLWTPPMTELEATPDMVPCHIHQLTHRRLHLYVQPISELPVGKGKWVEDISQLALPTGIHRLLHKHRIGA